MGRQWYDDGKLLKKKSTFTDFIACAEMLFARKYAAPEKLFAMGGSAGGLLMGAVINMRPELFKGVVADVPFVDVVTTMLDESIPLTTSEYDEWGNPNDKTYYEYMLSYSPYDNVEEKDYPHLLVTAGLHDSQVQHWEPAKWVARLRATRADTSRLLLRCCTARSKSLTSLCRLQSHPAQYVSGIPSAAILLSISHPIRCSTRCLANVRARISGPMIAL